MRDWFRGMKAHFLTSRWSKLCIARNVPELQWVQTEARTPPENIPFLGIYSSPTWLSHFLTGFSSAQLLGYLNRSPHFRICSGELSLRQEQMNKVLLAFLYHNKGLWSIFRCQRLQHPTSPHLSPAIPWKTQHRDWAFSTSCHPFSLNYHLPGENPTPCLSCLCHKTRSQLLRPIVYQMKMRRKKTWNKGTLKSVSQNIATNYTYMQVYESDLYILWFKFNNWLRSKMSN